MNGRDSPPVNLAAVAALTALFFWLSARMGPALVADEVRVLPALTHLLALLGCIRLLQALLSGAAGLLEQFSARTPTGRQGTARWAGIRDIKAVLSPRRTGPFWGRFAGRRPLPLFIDYASNALTVAPSGSGKGIGTVIPAGLSIRAAKVIGDYKGELACILKKPLETRGEQVRILNPGGLWRERIGEGDRFNPLDTVTDDLQRPGGLRDVPDDLRELTAQLLPEPAGQGSDHTYFREGARRIIAMACVLEAMVEGRDATLCSVALLLEDRKALEYNLRWLTGVTLDGQPLPTGPMPIEQAPWAALHDPEDLAEFARLMRSWAANWLALLMQVDGRIFESFISSAQQALAPFAFGRLAPSMQRSTFSMNDLKDGRRVTTLFIVADASRMAVYTPYLGLMQWCAMTAIKRHPDHRRPVYFLMDEATNYRIHGLASLLTWGRSYGLRLHLIFQDFSAFEQAYGKAALETLLSETEIKQFLPGQRAPRTLDMIARTLGEQSVMAASLSEKKEGMHKQFSEAGRALMTADEVRRSPYGLLLVRRMRPALFTPVSYGQVHPWRRQADINPFHDKALWQKPILRL